MAQAQGYKIIGSNLLQSMLKSKSQIRENVNKRIRMCENLLLFCLSCKKDIYSFNICPQVEKEKKKGMMDINLGYVKKEDCIGHVQKRLGTALCSYKKNRWVQFYLKVLTVRTLPAQ